MSRSHYFLMAACLVFSLVIVFLYSNQLLDESGARAVRQDTGQDTGQRLESMGSGLWDSMLEWTNLDSAVIEPPVKSKRPPQVITDFKLLPSEVGGVIALEYGSGQKFVSSVSVLDYSKCPTKITELCIFHAGRYFKVNDELRELLPSAIDFHLNY
jgi:hypothetical protein